MKIKFTEEDNGIKIVEHKILAEVLIGRTVVMNDDQSFMVKYVSPDTVTLGQVSSTNACVRLAQKYKADDTLEKIRNNTPAEVFTDISDLIDIIHILKVNDRATPVVKQLYSKYGSNEAIPMEERLLAAGTLILALLDRRCLEVQRAQMEADKILRTAITTKMASPDSPCICGHDSLCAVKWIHLVPGELLKVVMDCPKCCNEITVERMLK
jgi:hypothetical protein